MLLLSCKSKSLLLLYLFPLYFCSSSPTWSWSLFLCVKDQPNLRKRSRQLSLRGLKKSWLKKKKRKREGKDNREKKKNSQGYQRTLQMSISMIWLLARLLLTWWSPRRERIKRSLRRRTRTITTTFRNSHLASLKVTLAKWVIPLKACSTRLLSLWKERRRRTRRRERTRKRTRLMTCKRRTCKKRVVQTMSRQLLLQRIKRRAPTEARQIHQTILKLRNEWLKVLIFDQTFTYLL